ncbi:hypothetical protein E2C01_087171 [Portunus trituberculatus]|uniref:Uncharacterized protein n=1 Tax=Portunus trituberculatus TaxID=210409 RepID=A0A5B7JB82_PORTR|nr:hypothetical protein [Portunus trituberculatus]
MLDKRVQGGSMTHYPHLTTGQVRHGKRTPGRYGSLVESPAPRGHALHLAGLTRGRAGQGGGGLSGEGTSSRRRPTPRQSPLTVGGRCEENGEERPGGAWQGAERVWRWWWSQERRPRTAASVFT